MKIRPGADPQILRLSSTQFGRALVGGLIGIFGAGIGVAFIVSDLASSGSGPGMFILHPLIFAGVGLYFLSTARRLQVILRRTGKSETRELYRLGLKRGHEVFDVRQIHHAVLHTDERISRNKNGSSRYRVSNIYFVQHDGREVLVGFKRKAGIGGQQPLLPQADEVARWLGVELHRTGVGAPPGMGAYGHSSYGPDAPGGQPHPDQQAPAGREANQADSWYNSPDSFGGVR